jgi:hypothetical protein
LLRKIFLSFLVCGSLTVGAQGILEYKLDGSERGKPVAVFLEEIERKSNARFFFLSEWLESMSFRQSYEGKTLGEALDHIFQGTGLSYVSMHADEVVIIKDPTQAILRKQAIETAVRQQKKIVPYSFGEPGNVKGGQRIIIKGHVIDSKTKEPMARTNIQVSDAQLVTTDETGKYVLTLAPGAYVLNFSFINHEDKVIDLSAYADGEINLEMDEIPIMLEEVVIQDRATRELTTSGIGLTQLTIRDIKRAPPVLGEVDLIKQVQTLPGVTTVGEAASGFNVRGGSVDQNLILYDGMPAFNSSHVFGFFSAFNAEAVRDVAFYRGGIPAEYGGRASSVLDIKSKDGDYKKWNGNAGIGMLTSNFMINGPIQREKTSVAASFRSSYSNWLIHSVHTDYANLSNSMVAFYDGTLKLTHLINERTKLSFTGYSSKDAFRLTGDSTYQWRSLQGSLKLDHQFSSVLGAEFVAGISTYDYKLTNADYLTALQLSYRVTSYVFKAGFHYQEGSHKANLGWQGIYYQFEPGQLTPTSPASNAKPISMDKQYSIENAFHGADAWSINDKLLMEGGVRLPMFVSFGPASVNVYKSGVPRETVNVTDTLHFKGGQVSKAYFGFEPRLSLRWMTSPTASVKLGYNRIYQFLHFITNTTAVTPVDIWQPSGYYFKPQRADQISIGYFEDLREKKYGFSTEVFYKGVKNVLDFKDGAQLILNKHLETDLLQGKGWSYGVETSFSKNIGRVTGTLNYTYSRSFRQITGPTASESVNGGNAYPSNFDQPHIVNFSWKYNLSRRYYFTGNWTYHTGRPVTIPLSAFPIENMTVAYFSGRNQYRIPDYHRLDVALVFEGNHKRKKRGEGTWVISVYNVYGRKNPYSIFFKSDGSGIPQPYQLSILGSALPSISYNVKF